MTPARTRRRSPDSAPATGQGAAFECDVVYRTDEARIFVRGDLEPKTIAVVRRAVLAAAALPISRVTIDLERVDAVDRYSVNVLVTLRDQVRERSTRFVLTAVSPPVHRALAAAHVSDLFELESVWAEYPAPEVSS